VRFVILHLQKRGFSKDERNKGSRTLFLAVVEHLGHPRPQPRSQTVAEKMWVVADLD